MLPQKKTVANSSTCPLFGKLSFDLLFVDRHFPHPLNSKVFPWPRLPRWPSPLLSSPSPIKINGYCRSLPFIPLPLYLSHHHGCLEMAGPPAQTKLRVLWAPSSFSPFGSLNWSYLVSPIATSPSYILNLSLRRNSVLSTSNILGSFYVGGHSVARVPLLPFTSPLCYTSRFLASPSFLLPLHSHCNPSLEWLNWSDLPSPCWRKYLGLLGTRVIFLPKFLSSLLRGPFSWLLWAHFLLFLFWLWWKFLLMFFYFLLSL